MNMAIDDVVSRRDFLKKLGIGLAGAGMLVMAEPIVIKGIEHLANVAYAEENTTKLTQQQKDNLEKYGYPWDEVYSELSLDQKRKCRGGTNAENWKKLYDTHPEIKSIFKNGFDKLMNKVTDGNLENDELFSVAYTEDNYLLFKFLTNKKENKYYAYSFIGNEGVNNIIKYI
jgi:hypothetical protein